MSITAKTSSCCLKESSYFYVSFFKKVSLTECRAHVSWGQKVTAAARVGVFVSPGPRMVHLHLRAHRFPRQAAGGTLTYLHFHFLIVNRKVVNFRLTFALATRATESDDSNFVKANKADLAPSDSKASQAKCFLALLIIANSAECWWKWTRGPRKEEKNAELNC